MLVAPSFIPTWVHRQPKHNTSIMKYGDKSVWVQTCYSYDISDDNFIFYGQKVAKSFGFHQPKRVLLHYDIDRNIFNVVAVAELESPQESRTRTRRAIISLQSTDDEASQVLVNYSISQ
jgi:hypothetical protein